MARRGFIKARCYFCRKSLYRTRGHFNENLKLGHNFFCSKTCEGKFRSKKILLVCGRLHCPKKFYRTPKNISPHNYCSTSCAAIVNNSKYPKWPEKKCQNRLCSKMHRRIGSSYCSIKCGKIGRFKYTKPDIVDILNDFYKRTKRIPAKRELKGISDKCINMFGSWNNAIRATGLEPNRSHDNRMYKRSKTKADDGHRCDSISEALIDNWLTKNNIMHERDFLYPDTNHKADWVIANCKIFIEYFGLANDSPRYYREIIRKRGLCKEHRIRLIEIYPTDLYPRLSLEKKFTGVVLTSI